MLVPVTTMPFSPLVSASTKPGRRVALPARVGQEHVGHDAARRRRPWRRSGRAGARSPRLLQVVETDRPLRGEEALHAVEEVGERLGRKPFCSSAAQERRADPLGVERAGRVVAQRCEHLLLLLDSGGR